MKVRPVLVASALTLFGCSLDSETAAITTENIGVETQALAWCSCNGPSNQSGPPANWVAGQTAESCAWSDLGGEQQCALPDTCCAAKPWHCCYPTCMDDPTFRFEYYAPSSYEIGCVKCPVVNGVQTLRNKNLSNGGRYDQCCRPDPNWCNTRCGTVTDNCGYQVTCKPCQTCQTCASMGYTCGSFTNNCGQSLNCGGCGAGGTCVGHTECTCRPPYYLCDYGRCGLRCTPY